MLENKEPGFKVPENYFEDFNKRMIAMLPEKESETPREAEVKTQVIDKPSMWLRVRPYIYAAASIAGICCMITVFNHINGTEGNSIGEIAAKMHTDDNADEFVMNGGVSEYDIMTYDDSVKVNAKVDDEGDELKSVTQ